MNNSAPSSITADEAVGPLVLPANSLLALAGRVGRMAFFWTQLLSVAIAIAAGQGGAWLIENNNLWLALMGAFPLMFLGIYLGFAAGLKRCHDLGKSGWWYLLTVIPIINIAFGLYLLFSGGERRQNRFGLPPSPNGTTPSSPPHSALATTRVNYVELPVSDVPSSSPSSPVAQLTKPILDAKSGPSEDIWAAAITEFDSPSRRPGLWARVFADAHGNEGAAKANYLRHRAEELMQEKEAILEQKQHEAKVAEVEASLAHHAAERRVYALLPKGMCPNCEAAILPLAAKMCTKCLAILDSENGWRVIPIDESRQVDVLKAAFSSSKELTIDEVIFLINRSATDSSLLEMKNKNCDTLLHKTAELGLPDEAKILIANGANAGTSNLQGQKPFALAQDLKFQGMLREAVGATVA